MTNRRRVVCAPVLLSIVLLAFAGAAATLQAAERYDPRLRFRQIRTTHFTIYFHQGEEALAGRLATVAEDVHASLTTRLQVEHERRHTYIVLVDQHDEANGWATPLPYNLMELSASAPAPSSLIGYTDDWLRLVFTHEYTHVLHLDRSRGLFRALRLVMGRAPLLFPNIYLPGWNTEGLATAVETVETGRGRLESGEFRTIVDAAAREDRFDPLDRASGGLVDWPGGHAAYAYGARFHEFLTDRYGEEKVAAVAKATAGRIPYVEAGAYKQVLGIGLSDLWSEFERAVAHAASGAPAATAEATRLTAHGFIVAGPRWTPDGSGIVYSLRTPHGFPSLMEIPFNGGSPRRLAERYFGERTSVGPERILFDQQEFDRSVGLKHDLYVLDRRTGEVQRLTRHARVRDGDARWNDGSVVAVMQHSGRSDLVRYGIRSDAGRWSLEGPEIVAREDETQYAAPRWAPDGQRVALERRRRGRSPDVVVLHTTTGEVLTRIVATEGRVCEPEWTSDGTSLIVSWERPRQPFNLYRVQLDGTRVDALVELPNGARSAALSPDGRRVAFVGYSAEGYDLFTAPLVPRPMSGREGPRVGTEVVEQSNSRTVEQSNSQAVEQSSSRTVEQSNSGDYSPFPTLLPRFWMPVASAEEERLEVGAGTAGFDALGRHLYAVTATWSDRARPDWTALYVYDRWRPSFFLSASDDVERWQGGDYRETTLDVGMTLPFRTVRRVQTLLGALHATREEDPGDVFQRRSVRLGYQVSTARRYGYSISPEDGTTVGGSVDVTRRALGADGDAVTATLDLRAYPRVGGVHRVLALRAAAGRSWGDRDARRIFGAGGASAPASPASFSRSAVGLARGFGTDEIVGDKAFVLNADYRFPLATVERGFRTWPVLLRQLHAAAFVDAAHAWVSGFDWNDTRVSAGAELSADIVLGHYLPLTLAGGVAARRDPLGDRRDLAVFGRVGYAF